MKFKKAAQNVPQCRLYVYLYSVATNSVRINKPRNRLQIFLTPFRRTSTLCECVLNGKQKQRFSTVYKIFNALKFLFCVLVCCCCCWCCFLTSHVENFSVILTQRLLPSQHVGCSKKCRDCRRPNRNR